MSRIEATFNRLREQGRKALIPFITAGDPAPELTVPLLHKLVEAGADILELGVPFSDPMADGPVIQRASERALRHGVSLKGVLAMVGEFRKKDAATPVVLMGYANPIEAMGQAEFASRAARSGVDGVLTVDYPPEESRTFVEQLDKEGIAPIFLLSPTTTEARVRQVAEMARGFLYYVSLKGVTGASHLDLAQVAGKIAKIRQDTRLPVGVGFGIRDAETARAVAAFADAVVIGSRIVQEIEQSPRDRVLQNVFSLVRGFRDAVGRQTGQGAAAVEKDSQ